MRGVVLVAALLAGCGDDGGGQDEAGDETFAFPDVPAEPVAAEFEIVVDGASGDLDGPTLEPRAAPVQVQGGTADLVVTAHAKRVRGGWNELQVHLYVENRSALGLARVAATVAGDTPVRDVTGDAFAPAAAPGEALPLGGIAPEGLGHLVLALPDAPDPVRLTVHVEGVRTRRVAARSSTIAMSPDGAEVWVPFPDGDVVAVIDAATRQRVAQLPLAGRPTGVAVTPDGALVLVTLAGANQVVVVDRARREVVERFGEAEGIGREPRAVVVAPDGAHAYVSSYVGDSLTALARRGPRRFVVEGVVPVGRRPLGLSVSPDGATVLVSHFLPRGPILDNEGWVTLLAARPLRLVREVVLRDDFNEAEAACFRRVFGPSVPTRELTTEGVPTQLAGVFLSPGGDTAWTPGTRISGNAVWERGPNAAPLSSLSSLRPGELAAPFVTLLDARRPGTLAPASALGVLDAPRANPDFVRCAELPAQIELLDRDVIPDAPDQQVNRGVLLPTYVAGLSATGLARVVEFTRGGRRALLVSHAADEIAVYDAVTHHPTAIRHAPLSGSNPTGLAVSPDGQTAWIAYANSPFVSLVDLSAYARAGALPGPSYVPYEYRTVPAFPDAPGVLGSSGRLVRHVGDVPDRPPITELAQVAVVDADPLDPVLRRGAVLFASSNPEKHPRLTRSRLGFCGACHPDGGSDGSAWATMEGERRTMSLRGGIAGRGWLHASATHRDAVEFVRTIVQERLGGDLAEDDVTALASYVAFGIPALQRPVVDPLLAARGATVFAAQCAGCHVGEALGSGNPDPADPFGGGAAEGPVVHDLGTATDDVHVMLGAMFVRFLPPGDAEVIGLLRGDRALGPGDRVQEVLDFRPRPARARGAFKAPSLVDVYDAPLLFHDGRFTDLADAVAYIDAAIGAGLSPADLRAVVEYLKTL